MKTVALWNELNPFATSIVKGAKADAIANKIDIIYEDTVSAEASDDELNALVDRIIASGRSPDAIVGGTYYDGAVKFLKAAKAKKLFPKAVIVRMSDPNIDVDLGEDARYGTKSSIQI